VAKLNIFTLFIISGFLGLAGCHGGGSGEGGPSIIPVPDVSMQRFTVDKVLDKPEDRFIMYKSSNPGCDTYDGPGNNKLDPRLTNGFRKTTIESFSGSGHSPASTTMETTKISDRTDNSYVARTTFTLGGSQFTMAMKCTFTSSGDSKGLECDPFDDETKNLLSSSPSSDSGCRFTESSDQTSTPQDYLNDVYQAGHYTLLGGKKVLAYRESTTRSGRWVCDKKDVGPATQTWVMVSSPDLPTTGSGCSTAEVYTNTYNTDGQGHHLKSESTEVSDFSQ